MKKTAYADRKCCCGWMQTIIAVLLLRHFTVWIILLSSWAPSRYVTASGMTCLLLGSQLESPESHINFQKRLFCLGALSLLMWSIGWAPNNARRWQMGFNSAFKGLISVSVDVSEQLIPACTLLPLLPACLVFTPARTTSKWCGCCCRIWQHNRRRQKHSEHGSYLCMYMLLTVDPVSAWAFFCKWSCPSMSRFNIKSDFCVSFCDLQPLTPSTKWGSIILHIVFYGRFWVWSAADGYRLRSKIKGVDFFIVVILSHS